MTQGPSFVRSLFHGVIPEEKLFPYPESPPDERENILLIVESVRAFGARVDSDAIDRAGSIPPAILQGCKELGLFGLNVPLHYGGLGLSCTAQCRVLQEIAAVDGAIALTVAAHQLIGAEAIRIFGTEAQKRRYLPKLATGEWVAAFALAEVGAGADTAGVQTQAVLNADSTEYVINGEKRWVTNAPFADVFVVIARTAGHEGDVSRPRLTAFIVERAFGVVHGPDDDKMGVRGMATATVQLRDVRVPPGNVLGETGNGDRVMMSVRNGARPGLAAIGLGAARALLARSVTHAGARRAFGRPIGEYGMIKDKIARMLADTYALESMTYLTAGWIDARETDDSLERAICKVFASETLWRTAHEAGLLAAGDGYMRANGTERLVRDARALLAFDTGNEILRAFVALAGIEGVAQQRTEIARAVREPLRGFGVLSEFALQRARSALGRERLDRVHPLLKRESVVFETFTGQLAQQVDKVLRRHGETIAEMQYTQHRLADLAIDLYAVAAVLARTTRAIEKKGEDGARREIDLATMFCNAAEKRMQGCVGAFDVNDDELRKGIASRAYADGGYPFDVV